MAVNKSANTAKVICPFYLYSSCQDGDSCKYDHDKLDSRKDTSCFFFPNGSCKFGDKCWFLHSTIQKDANSNYLLSCHTNGQNMKSDDAATKQNLASNSLMNNNSSSRNKWLPVYEHKIKFESKVNFNQDKCPYGQQCMLNHGNSSELCPRLALKELQRMLHVEKKEKEIQKNAKLSTVIHTSLAKTCGLCKNVIMEKEIIPERLFGILENCKHVFCLSCIRNWRMGVATPVYPVEQCFNSAVTRACPECRTPSYFVTPSQYWVEPGEEKSKLIDEYKVGLRRKPCRYFKQGEGVCHFGESCFFLHSGSDGQNII